MISYISNEEQINGLDGATTVLKLSCIPRTSVRRRALNSLNSRLDFFRTSVFNSATLISREFPLRGILLAEASLRLDIQSQCIVSCGEVADLSFVQLISCSEIEH